MVGYLTRIELRRHGRDILLLALLVALVVGTVLASIAGARRARTAFDRYVTELRAPDAMAFGDPAAVARLGRHPAVDALVPMELAAIFPEAGGDDAFYPMMSTRGGQIPNRYLRIPVVDGRRPDSDEPLEVALSEHTAERLGVQLGDQLPMASFTPETSERIGAGEDAAPDGPRLLFEVVGILRDPNDIGSRRSDITLTFLSPAFRDRYGTEVIGSVGSGTFVVLREGHRLSELADTARDASIELDNSFTPDGILRQGTPTMRAIAAALMVFGGVAALAGLVAVGQTAARLQQGSADDDRTLAALGVARRTRWARLSAPSTAAVVSGTSVGLVVAVLASPLFPVGLARRAEPDPGVDVDGRVLVTGGLVALVVGGAVAAGLAAWNVRRSARAARPVRISRWGRAAAGRGAPTTLTSGLSLAAGTPGSPGRAAVGGTLLGVLGVLAVLVFGASIEHLRQEPALYGWGWDAVLEGADLSDLGDRASDMSRLAADDDLQSVGQLTSQLAVTIDGVPDFAMAARDRKGHLSPVMVRGAAPVAGDELALGRDTLARVGAAVGDTVSVSVGGTPQPMHITGVVALPVPEDGGSSASGAYLSAAAADRLDIDAHCDAGDSCTRSIALEVRDGVDVATIAERYSDPGAGVVVQLPSPPGEIERLSAVQDLPRYLALFLTTLAAVTVSFATATTLRRRRADLAMLRVLGMSSRQLRTVVSAFVLALTAAGALAGAALGVIVGRQVWRAVATSVSLPFAPSLPVSAVVLVPVAALVLGQVVAASTRRTAGRTPAALVLRAE